MRDLSLNACDDEGEGERERKSAGWRQMHVKKYINGRDLNILKNCGNNSVEEEMLHIK